MAIFNCYVSSPEGTSEITVSRFQPESQVIRQETEDAGSGLEPTKVWAVCSTTTKNRDVSNKDNDVTKL